MVCVCVMTCMHLWWCDEYLCEDLCMYVCVRMWGVYVWGCACNRDGVHVCGGWCEWVCVRVYVCVRRVGSSQTNDFNLDTCRFLAWRSELLGLGKDWLAQCQDNMTEWCDGAGWYHDSMYVYMLWFNLSISIGVCKVTVDNQLYSCIGVIEISNL